MADVPFWQYYRRGQSIRGPSEIVTPRYFADGYTFEYTAMKVVYSLKGCFASGHMDDLAF